MADSALCDAQKAALGLNRYFNGDPPLLEKILIIKRSPCVATALHSITAAQHRPGRQDLAALFLHNDGVLLVAAAMMEHRDSFEIQARPFSAATLQLPALWSSRGLTSMA